MPLVSVVMSTYNRSDVLRLAVSTVLAQSTSDWELIVVGDACTDDTANVVASFGDERIRFVNRSENFGEQSGPNNDGVALARGRFVAFLNHDDLWLPHHLETCIDAIEKSGADLVFTEPLLANSNGTTTVNGASAFGEYAPEIFAPASTWLFRRELATQVGPWRAAQECFAVPSQDWLYRAWRSGKKMVAVSKVTLIVIASGMRSNSYASRDEEHQHWLRRMREEPDLIEKEMTSIAARMAAENVGISVSRHLSRAAKNAFRRFFKLIGVHSHAARNAVLFRRRGGAMAHIRKVRGLAS